MDANGEARGPLVGVLTKLSREAKALRAINCDGRGSRGVGASSVSAPLKSWIAEIGPVRESPAAGGLALPLGVLARQ